MPWPLSNRCLYVDVSASQIEGEDKYAIITKSVFGDKWLDNLLIDKSLNKNVVEVSCHYACFIVERIDDNKTRLSAFAKFNPHIKNLPKYLMLKVIELIGYGFAYLIISRV